MLFTREDRLMDMRYKTTSRGFSLIELVIVVVLIGIIAAIAIPRLSRGAAGAADSSLAGDLAQLRSAMICTPPSMPGPIPRWRHSMPS